MTKPFYIIAGSLVAITGLSGAVLRSTIVSADNDSGTDTLNINVPIACTMSGNINTAHTATINNGTYSGASGSEYENGIGKTTLTTYCNDQNGFSIYAIGYTGNVAGNTNLVGTSVSGNATIATGTATSGPTSSWSMKVTKVTDSSTSYTPANMSITNSFNDYHVVPDAYTKVAEYHAATGSSATDTILGAKVETTYAAFISSNQIADTYSGQVKYVMVHPYDDLAPIEPLADSDCPINSICYIPNASDIVGSMDSISSTKITKSPLAGVQSAGSSGTYVLIAPNYSRAGYGFAGWSPDFNATTSSTIYGPNQTITTATDGTGDADVSEHGLILYPVWIASTGNLQDSSRVATLCGSGSGSLTQATYNSTTGKMEATLTSMTALTDQRDGNVYTIAKLADGKCWMTENLRLNAENTIGDTNKNLSQGYGTSTTYGNFTGLANSENANFDNTNPPVANSLYSTDGSTTNTIQGGNSSYYAFRMPRYNNNNTNRSLIASYNGNGDTTYYQWYSYGNNYSWAAAMASVIEYTGPTTQTEGKTSETANTSLCPSGWRLPYGRNTGNGATAGGFSYLDTQMGGSGTNATPSTNPTGAARTIIWRSFPNNFVYSGLFNFASAQGRGTGSGYSVGGYWSSTVVRGDYVYYTYLNHDPFSPGTNEVGNKRSGHSIRCISDN